MEPPSPSLSAALQELNLAGPRDLRRAARHCRLLARDMPAFDSVWIDALVRLRTLTLFQARELQDGRAARLRIGDYILRSPLGAGLDGGTFLARRVSDSSGCVVKELVLPVERRSAVLDRLRRSTESLRGLQTSAIVPAETILDEDARIAIISPHVGGIDARAILIRQGRLSAADVSEIVRRLLPGLAELHRRGLSHGEIHAGNLRLDGKRTVVLVDPGVRDAVSPVLTFHEARSPVWYEGTAPERIGTGAPASAASDVYAIGCLLWHLLAGRPPFPNGDALSMLAAHRSRPLPSIREFAPETPPLLIEFIGEATQLDPASRPNDLEDWAKRFRSSRRTVRYSHRTEASKPLERGFPWPLAATVLLTLGGIGATLADRQTVSTLLSINFVRQGAINPLAKNDAATHLQAAAPLPSPDEHGVITLEHAGPFAVSDVTWQGTLVLRGQANRPATLIVSDRPLHLRADEITLENVQFVHRPATGIGTGVPAMLLVESQNLTIRSCRFESPSDSRGAPSGIAWRLIDRRDPTAGRLQVESSIATGVREVLFLADPPRQLRLSNVLAVGAKSLLSFHDGGSAPVDVSIERATVRGAETVLRCGEISTSGSLRVIVRDTVLDIPESGPLVTASRLEDAKRIRWQGAGVVTSGSVRGFSVSGQEPGEVTTTIDPIVVAGVTPARVEFAGPFHGSDAASVATVRGVPRPAGQALGFDLSKLPPRTSVPAASHEGDRSR